MRKGSGVEEPDQLLEVTAGACSEVGCVGEG
jgi:hypothetical protein